MDRPSPPIPGNLESVSGAAPPDPGGSHGDDDEARAGSAFRVAAEHFSDVAPSPAPDRAEPLSATALAAPGELITVERGDVIVVVGLHAPNGWGDLQQEPEFPVEGVASNSRGEGDVGELDAPQGVPNLGDGGGSDPGDRGEPDPGNVNDGLSGLHLFPSREDDLGQGQVEPIDVVEPERQPNLGRRENVEVGGLDAPNSSADDFRQQLEVRGDHKRSLEEAAKQLLEASSLEELRSNEGDSLVCPICMEPWTNTGDHRICSLACGHLFGKSCIKRWLRQAGRKSSRCPHCNKRAKWEDLRTLYVPQTLAVEDGEAQQLVKEVRALKHENLRLKLENEKLLLEVRQNKGKNGLLQGPALQSFVDNSETNPFVIDDEPPHDTARSESLQNLRNMLMFSTQSSLPGRNSGQWFDWRNDSANSFRRQAHVQREAGSNETALPNSTSSRAGRFQLQNEVRVHGGKVFDIDAESHTVIFSNKVEGSGSGFGLSKMSLLSCAEIDKIDLPSGFGAIRDIRLSPSGTGGTGKCALVASTGKKLSLVSLESNNIVLTYSVQSPPWSCVWDPHVPNLFYSGLQNGALLLVDLRQTSSPVAMLNGPSVRPLHTLQLVPGQSAMQHPSMERQVFGGREILSASNTGISLWHLDASFAGSEIARPQCVFSDKETVCISLTYECSINTAVASFRRSPSSQTASSSSIDPGPTPGQTSSQPENGASNRRSSPAANSCEEPSHWIFSRGQESSWTQPDERIRTAEFRLPWEGLGEMVGNKSQSLMPRTAIIPRSNFLPRSKSLFACGDEETNSVWLWDLSSCRLTDTLIPHQSPILDVKNVQIQEKDMLGCVSEGTFQIYERRSVLE